MHLKKICCFLLALIGIIAYQSPETTLPAAFVYEKKLIPRNLLFGNPVKASPSLSIEGTKLAYLAPDANNVLNVWVKDLTVDKPDMQVTNDVKRGIRNYVWQCDQEHILYIQDKEGDENWHLYQTELATQKTRDLTPFDGITAHIVAYSEKYPDTMLIQMNQRNPTLHDVYRLDLVSGELKLDTENPGGVIGWTADHDLCVRASQSMTDDGSTLISIRDHAADPWRELVQIGAFELQGDLAGFSADGKALYCLTSLDGNTVRLMHIDLETGMRQVVVENPLYDIEDVMFNPSSHTLEAVGYSGEKYTIQALDPQLSSDLNFIQESIGETFDILSRDLKNQNWIIARISDSHPTAFYHYQRENKNVKFLFSTQPELDNYTLSSMQPISYLARDGMKIYAYLTLPVGLEPENLPLVLMVHGGPAARDSWGLQPSVQWLANRGYAVLQINYRGSTGYGKDYLNAGNREWGRKMHLDLLDGKQWAIESGIADPAKIAIYGGSYGGYATLAGLAFTPDEFCCGVDLVGPSNLITLLQSLPPYWSPMKAQMDRRIGSLENEPEFLQACSPFFKADQIKKPLLIAQGANDPRVKQAESDQIVQAMRKNNLPVEYLLFSDEGHGFARPQNRLKFFAAMEEFLAKHLGGHFVPSIPEENWESVRK